MGIADEKLQELKQLDILPIAQHYLPELRKQGSAWKCKSPFKEENTPSFTIISNARDNYFKCFASDKAGDVIEFVKEINNTDFIGACKILAELTGIDLEVKESKSNYMDNTVKKDRKVIGKKSLLKKENFKPKQSYQKPNIIQQEPNKSVLDVFSTRNISEDIVKAFGITESDTYFPQIGSKSTSINFNYYKENELVNVKHRAVDKKAFSLEKGCELVLYNYDNIEDDADYLFITEGEFDALALAEYYGSVKNIVSVPNGASGKENALKYLDGQDVNDKLSNKRLSLFFDNDSAGKLLTDAFIKRYGAHRCLVPEYPNDCKDINDVLIKYGSIGVKKCITSVRYDMIDGILDMRHIAPKARNYYDNGFPICDRIGLNNFDSLLGFRGGELTMVTGISGSGKSEFLDYIMVQLAKRHAWKFGICSMENPPDIHFTKIAEKYTNKPFENIYDPMTGEVYQERMNEQEYESAEQFVFNHFNFITHATKKQDGNTHRSVLSIDYILDQAKKLVSMYGTKGLVIDPWNTIEHDIKNNEMETNYVSRILSKIIAFAEDYNVHVFLVAHPTKGVTLNGVDRVATLNDISGSGNFFNKTHNGISVFREKDTQKNPNNLVEVHIQKVKFKFVGTLGSCRLELNLLVL
jgi:twinkle protein